MPQYLYIITSETNHLKIGISNDPESRIRSVKTGSYAPLALVLTVECRDIQSAISLEKLLHKRFEKMRVEGEWFDMKLSDVVDELEYCLSIAECITGMNHYQNVFEKIIPASRKRRRKSQDNGIFPLKLEDKKYQCPVCDKVMTRQAWQRHPCRFIK